ncbi:MAG: quinone oxidoreductase family protein [Mycobacteriaceae bacterium]
MTSVVIATAFGGPEVLALVTENLDQPGPGQVLIDVRAAGVNPFDLKIYSGNMGNDPKSLPMRLGSEAAGVVLAVGRDAVGITGEISVGDEVIVHRAPGAYAGQLLVAAKDVAAKPENMSFEQASGLMLTGTTAIHLLQATSVKVGDTVLIHGGAGGVGLMAIQIAKARGAQVIVTASAGRHNTLEQYGALAVEYGPGLAGRVQEIAPYGVDVALDLVGSDEAVDVSLDLVSDRSRVATIAAFGRAGAAGIKLLGGGPGADPGTEVRNNARVELVNLVTAGQLEVTVDKAFPLTEVAAAHTYLGTGHAQGKVVLIP